MSRGGQAAAYVQGTGNKVVKSAMGRLSSFQKTIPMHYLDSMITWMMGVVSGLQYMAQVLDTENCKVPDYYIHRTTTCACGDDPVQIPIVRRRESQYWCTGTLKMLDGFGKPTYVYNPWSFEELRLMLEGSMDEYLECISKMVQDQFTVDCTPLKPTDSIIDPQGVSLIAVFQRCKANYQQMQWDEGAFLMHDSAKIQKLLRGVMPPPAIHSDPGSVGECLLAAEEKGGSNLACWQDHAQMSAAVYWRYERISRDERDTANIDACLVFSGPAASNHSRADEFKKCSSDYEDDGCRIPHMVWSLASRNKVSS